MVLAVAVESKMAAQGATNMQYLIRDGAAPPCCREVAIVNKDGQSSHLVS